MNDGPPSWFFESFREYDKDKFWEYVKKICRELILDVDRWFTYTANEKNIHGFYAALKQFISKETDPAYISQLHEIIDDMYYRFYRKPIAVGRSRLY